jgi:hypothetical protein
VTTEITEQALGRGRAATQITVFWAGCAEVSASPALGTFYVYPAGMGGGHALTLMFPSKTSRAEQLVIADRFLAGVQRWRDGIADAAKRERTDRDELAAAREEIARLKAERDGSDAE